MFFRKKEKRRARQSVAADASPRDESLFQGVMLAYVVLLLHVVLLGGIAVLIFLFGGIVHYFSWILLGAVALLAGSAYLVYKKIRQDRRALQKLLQLPELRGRNLEISFLGGAASVRVGQNTDNEMPFKQIAASAPALPGDHVSSRIKDIGELGRLYEQSLITAQEYERLKKEILDDSGTNEAADNQTATQAAGLSSAASRFYKM